MKIKVILTFLIIIFISLLNVFNQQISSFLYSKKFSTILDGRNKWYGMCNNIVDFKINNLKIIFVGDSHLFSGINLEILNEKIPKLSLSCSIPAITFEDNLKLSDYLINKYNPDLIFITLSQFQFQKADLKKENERKNQFNKMIEENPYSFQFYSLRSLANHFIDPFSETTVAYKQRKFFENKNKFFFDKFDETIDVQLNKIVQNRYNKFPINMNKNLNLIKDYCKKSITVKSKIIFLDIPTPYFLKKNLFVQKKYEKLISSISNCYKVIKSEEINYLSDKKFYLDRYAKFESQEKLKYDISHLNYLGALVFTNYLVEYIKKKYND